MEPAIKTECMDFFRRARLTCNAVQKLDCETVGGEVEISIIDANSVTLRSGIEILAENVCEKIGIRRNHASGCETKFFYYDGIAYVQDDYGNCSHG